MALLDVSQLRIKCRPVTVGVPKDYSFVKSGVINRFDSKSCFIICSNGNIDETAVRVFIGSKNHFSEVEVVDADVLRDGGSISIKTTKGEFLFPHFSRDEPATFNGEPIDDIYQ
jgi:hypothetical protein